MELNALIFTRSAVLHDGNRDERGKKRKKGLKNGADLPKVNFDPQKSSAFLSLEVTTLR